MTFTKKLILSLAAVLTPFGLVFIFWPMFKAGQFSQVPSEHDVRLVGVWESRKPYQWGIVRKVVTFSADGKGIGTEPHMRHFSWGTKDGVLYLKYMSVDAWSTPHFRYSIASDGRTVTFEGATDYSVPDPVMHVAGDY